MDWSGCVSRGTSRAALAAYSTLHSVCRADTICHFKVHGLTAPLPGRVDPDGGPMAVEWHFSLHDSEYLQRRLESSDRLVDANGETPGYNELFRFL